MIARAWFGPIERSCCRQEGRRARRCTQCSEEGAQRAHVSQGTHACGTQGDKATAIQRTPHEALRCDAHAGAQWSEALSVSTRGTHTVARSPTRALLLSHPHARIASHRTLTATRSTEN